MYETKGSEFNGVEENLNNSRANLRVKGNLDRVDSDFLPDADSAKDEQILIE